MSVVTFSNVSKSKEKRHGEHNLTIGGLNRFSREVYMASTASALVKLITVIALLICSTAGFAQERSAASSESANSSVSGQVKAITGQGQTDMVAGVEVRLS